MEKSEYPLYECSICKDKFKFGKMRYSNNGRRLLCLDCYKRALKKENEKMVKLVTEPKINKFGEAVKVICIDCRYKFSIRKGSKVNLKCPYCGKDKLMKDETTAEKLIDEVSKNPGIY